MAPGSSRTRARRIAAWLGSRLLVLLVIGAILRLAGCMEYLFYVPTREPTPPPAEFGAESVWFLSGDGTRLHGWFIPARGHEAGQSTASVLHVHGNAGSILSHLWFTDYLPGAGFNLFIFDYRGYGQSEGRPRRRNALIADTHAALDALLARDDVDPDRIGMYGQSLGGGIGLNVMAERPEIRAAVLESPFDSWRRIASEAVGGPSPGPVARTLAAIFISDHRRPLDAIARIDRPILLLHGTADSIIALDHSQRLADAAGGPVELVELEGGDHNTLRESHPGIERTVVEFLRRHLPLDASSGADL